MTSLLNKSKAGSISLFCFFAVLLTPISLHAESKTEYPQKQLQQVLDLGGPGKVYLFDLDDTLFSTKNRNLKIFQAFVGNKSNCIGLVKVCNHIKKNLKLRHAEWKWQLTLQNLGLNAEQIAEFGKAFQPFWASKFFSNDWVKHDLLTAGAKEYVQQVFESGSIVFYLTGRNNEKMRAGTEAAIRAAGLPFDDDRVFLEMKPGNSDDTAFKKTVFEKVSSLGRLVAAYENEPRNIMAMADHPEFKGAKFFFLDTLNSGDDVDFLASRTDLIWTIDFKVQ